MNAFVGFVFTETPLVDLEHRGFSFRRDESSMPLGFRSFRFAFGDGTQFEIREILDERLYLKTFQVEHFEPFVGPSDGPAPVVDSANTVEGFCHLINSQSIEPSELRTFLEIRKVFPIWALWLRCRDFAKFCQVARPDRIFQWKGRSMALIHLGPNCFDLLVSSDDV